MPSLLGIDSGLTVTKAVVFDVSGRPLAVARRRVMQSLPEPRQVERDMHDLWRATAEAIAEAVAGCGRPASDIRAVGATAHGDGIYLLDAEERPVRPGILSLDSRAGAVVADWEADGTAGAALALTGQRPQAAAPSALLAWLRRHEPDRFARIAHILACKDWLRFCLTGTIGTDRTEASTSFTAVATQVYDPAALALFGLEALGPALPPVAGSAEVAGHVTAAAAALTGLRAGTPVVAGLHDVTASALGVGGHAEGVIAIVAGTYSINETVSASPRVDPRWLCRNAVVPGRWNNMAISPASAANYDWFLDTLCGTDRRRAEAEGGSIHDLAAAEIAAALERPSTAMFHPYLFGGPEGPAASAAFTGLRGWHDRGMLLRAVLEGIAFNHRVHVDALRDGFAAHAARLTGGISRNPVFAQMFADVLGLPVLVIATEEAAAWGAALCAGAGVGAFASCFADPQAGHVAQHRYVPAPVRSKALAERYHLFCAVGAAMAPLWPRIEALGQA